MAHFDFSEVKEFARDLGEAHLAARGQARGMVRNAAEQLVNQWQRNARETALPHGKWYPRSIGFDGPISTAIGWEATAGPDASMPQGGMGRGFEYGGVNQTYPHMDGNRAADDEGPRFGDRIDRWAVGSLRRHVAGQP